MNLSDYTPETERKVEQLLTEICTALQIQKPDDLFGSVVIEARYQNGRPIGQVDVQIRYVMKRTASIGRNFRARSGTNEHIER